MARKIVLNSVAEIPRKKEFSVVGKAVSGDGAALILCVQSGALQKVKETVSSGIGVFPKARMTKPQRFSLIELSEGHHKEIDIPALDVTFPFVDIFSDGHILLTGSRSQWRGKDDFDRNGKLIDAQGAIEAEFCLGDGIQTLSVDSRDRVWVSYFDEGVFGNFGWGGPGPEPIGSSGLNCFSRHGESLWSFPAECEPISIADCYAMNVSGDFVTIYVYTDFALCRISPTFEREYFRTELKGCGHFAISETRAMFTRQYHEKESTGYIGQLSEGHLADVERVEFVLSDGRELKGGEFIGRGDSLHYFHGHHWYRVSLGSLA